MTTTSTIIRIESLCRITGGLAEYYSTQKALTHAEREANVRWDGIACQHVPADPGRIVRAKTGSYAREVGGRAYAMTAAECRANNLAPGPANV